jgi:hypothetical protein
MLYHSSFFHLYYCFACLQLNVDPSIDMQDLGKMVEEQNLQIPWSHISKRMGNRSRLSVFKKWQKMSGISSFDTLENYVVKREPTMDEIAEELNSFEPEFKRMKREPDEHDSYYQISAKIAAETIEAVDLPDADTMIQM